MMRYLFVGLLLFGAILSLSAVSPKPPNTLELLNQPAYGDAAVFHAVLTRHYSDPKIFLWCTQPSPIGTVEFGEKAINQKYSNSLDTTITYPMTGLNWDSTQPARCSAALWVEPRSAQDDEYFISEFVDFIVLARS